MVRFHVGVCGCAPAYQGQFNGKVVAIDGFCDGALQERVSLSIHEVPIPERNHNVTLLGLHPHVFVDVHRLCDRKTTSLICYDYPRST